MGRWLDRLANRPVDVTVRHDQTGRAVTNQSGHEQTESQIRPRPLSMDGDRFRNGNGFPRWVPNDRNHQFPNDGGRGMADRPQTPKDVPTLGPESRPEVLL
jgi:hypothetical protein